MSNRRVENSLTKHKRLEKAVADAEALLKKTYNDKTKAQLFDKIKAEVFDPVVKAMLDSDPGVFSWMDRDNKTREQLFQIIAGDGFMEWVGALRM